MVDKGELEADRAVKVIEEVAPVLKDGALVLVLCKLVVDVIKTDSLGVEPVLHPADPIAPHLSVRDRLLRRYGMALCPAAPFLSRRSLMFRAGDASRGSRVRPSGAFIGVPVSFLCLRRFLPGFFPCLFFFLPGPLCRFFFLLPAGFFIQLCLDLCLALCLLSCCFAPFFLKLFLFFSDRLRLSFQLFLLSFLPGGKRPVQTVRRPRDSGVFIPFSHVFFLLSLRRCLKAADPAASFHTGSPSRTALSRDACISPYICS